MPSPTETKQPADSPERHANAVALFGKPALTDKDVVAAGIMSRSSFHKNVKLGTLRTVKISGRRLLPALEAYNLLYPAA